MSSFISSNNLKLNTLFNKVNQSWMIFWLIFIIILPFLILTGLIIKSEMMFKDYNLIDMLFSSDWKPMAGKFGFLPFILSSIWVTLLALLIAAPICLLTSIHLTQYSHPRLLKLMHPVIDILSGIPSVIYGVWGVIVIVPFVSGMSENIFGIQTSGFSILSGAIVLSIMIIPFILNILIDIFNTIPKELTESSLSLGAGKWYTIKHVLVRKAFPGIISAIGLGLSRALGETIAVLMVVGNVAKIPTGIFQPGYPLPALIANNYGEMMSIPRYDSALMFSALLLLVIILIFNILSRMMIMRYEKQYR
ncbi:MAG: phosphate ABC transporter permease subunit PstC [Prolixibacteraceae bacterium]|nr:phosphate ABC transporter permease subunit PstC [Prolixibacteraceae bacterium]